MAFIKTDEHEEIGDYQYPGLFLERLHDAAQQSKMENATRLLDRIFPGTFDIGAEAQPGVALEPILEAASIRKPGEVAAEYRAQAERLACTLQLAQDHIPESPAPLAGYEYIPFLKEQLASMNALIGHLATHGGNAFTGEEIAGARAALAEFAEYTVDHRNYEKTAIKDRESDLGRLVRIKRLPTTLPALTAYLEADMERSEQEVGRLSAAIRALAENDPDETGLADNQLDAAEVQIAHQGLPKDVGSPTAFVDEIREAQAGTSKNADSRRRGDSTSGKPKKKKG